MRKGGVHPWDEAPPDAPSRGGGFVKRSRQGAGLRVGAGLEAELLRPLAIRLGVSRHLSERGSRVAILDGPVYEFPGLGATVFEIGFATRLGEGPDQ